MRVVAGLVGGRRLQVPPGETTRPTSDLVRSAIFNSLASLDALDGAEVLDLFAGSGALGIEALSRGAVRATFVDRDRRSVATIRANLGALGLADRAKVVRDEVGRWLRAAGRADVALIDPPYAWNGWHDLLSGLQVDLVVGESDHAIGSPAGWEVLRTRRHGGTVVTLLQRQGDPAP